MRSLVRIERPTVAETPFQPGLGLAPPKVVAPPREPHGVFSAAGDRLLPPDATVKVTVRENEPSRMEPRLPGLAVIWQHGRLGAVFEDGVLVDPDRLQQDFSLSLWVSE